MTQVLACWGSTILWCFWHIQNSIRHGRDVNMYSMRRMGPSVDFYNSCQLRTNKMACHKHDVPVIRVTSWTIWVDAYSPAICFSRYNSFSDEKKETGSRTANTGTCTRTGQFHVSYNHRYSSSRQKRSSIGRKHISSRWFKIPSFSV